MVVTIVTTMATNVREPLRASTTKPAQRDEFDLIALGRRVRSLRHAAGLSTGNLANRAGISRAMIVAIESGAKAATVPTLHRVAQGLGTNMTRLLDDERSGDVILIRHADQRLARDPSGWERRNLAPVIAGSAFEFMRTHIPAGVDAGSFPPHAPGSREYVAVERGTLRLAMDGVIHVLGRGDSIAYRADVTHGFANGDDDDCVYYLALEAGIR